MPAEIPETPDTSDHHREHSHSRIRKLLDELDAVTSAAQANGRYESHHRREFDGFIDRLRKNFEEHANYEEEHLFEKVRGELDDEALEDLDRAVEQHRKFGECLERVESQFMDLEVETPTDREPFRHLEDEIASLQRIWSRHDLVEQRIFENASRENLG